MTISNDRRHGVWILLAAILLAAGVGATVLWRLDTRLAAMEEALASQRRELAAMQEFRRAMDQAGIRIVTGSAPAGRAAGNLQPLASESEKAGEMRGRAPSGGAAGEQARRIRAEAAFAREQVDPAWAAATELQLLDVANVPLRSAKLAPPADMQIDCRQRSCRVSGVFDNRGQAEDWSMLYTVSMAQVMPRFDSQFETLPDGRVRAWIMGQAR